CARVGRTGREVPCLFVTEVMEEPLAKRERSVAGAGRGFGLHGAGWKRKSTDRLGKQEVRGGGEMFGVMLLV
uniref:Uncharacterized protein n=1 Tax=Melopsittacus undulatus TaxID=13146 RepID=A0A8V5FHL3_MELUD